MNDDLKSLLSHMNKSEKENKSIDQDIEKLDGERLAVMLKGTYVKQTLWKV